MSVIVDLHFIVTTLLGLVCAGMGWFGRELWGAVQKLRSDLNALENKISAEYVRYDRMQDLMRPIMAKLDRIEDALTHKVDKP